MSHRSIGVIDFPRSRGRNCNSEHKFTSEDGKSLIVYVVHDKRRQLQLLSLIPSPSCSYPTAEKDPQDPPRGL